jgi:hypothetical protein
MRVSTPLATLIFLVALLTGCSSVQPLGGPYYLKSVDALPSPEPGVGSLLLFYKTGLRKTEISKRVGAFNDSIYRDFNWRVYGRNLAFVEYDSRPAGIKFQLFVYSEQHGRILVDPEFSQYWKVIASEIGITCHRYQNGQTQDDPKPVVYSAKYLAEL